MSMIEPKRATASDIESPYAWARMLVCLALMTIGGSGTYAVSVMLTRIQAEFGASRADVSLAYTLSMIGFGIGGVLMGRLADRRGVWVPAMLGAVFLCAGYVVAGSATSLWQFSLAQGVLIGLLGTSASFAPLIADTSRWFYRRRGIALAICMTGNYLAGTIWAPVLQHYAETVGWRQTYVWMGLFCLVAMLPLTLVLRRRPPDAGAPSGALAASEPATTAMAAGSLRPHGMSPNTLQVLLGVAGVACCVAMSMPQVHIVAYCGDLGFGAARGAEMLSLMLAMGIVSRIVSGWISDHIGGLRTLLLGSVLQGVALLMFLFTDGLASLYVVAAMFGLFQGGIVPSYALIVRENFPPREAGTRVGTVLMCTLYGMALGGWMSGAIFDATGSYRAAFLNGTAWNLVNVVIVLFLISRTRRGRFAPVPTRA
ncbi:MAG: MFS transporter [Betaproteobacteria bacterium]|nr:MAG: MFS transporter [Betaproteobacteria bacterium]